jgi:glycosyltransferase involved in cell wall biosynthesis
MYSVIISSIGRFEYLNELLESIFKQTIPANEILILLDENEFCRKGSASLPINRAIQYIFCEGLNLPQKRNLGAEIANSEKLIFSDDDDIWHNERAVNIIKALEKSDVCCHNFDKFGKVNGHCLNKLGASDKSIEIQDLLQGVNIFGGGSSIGSNKAVIKIFPFDKSYLYCEDFNWWVKIISSGVKVQYLGKSLVSYRTHDTNMTGAPLKIHKFSLRIARQTFVQGCYLFLISVSICIRVISASIKRLTIKK